MIEEHLTDNKGEEYRLCVVCNTYNQSAYIKDALDGFVIQKTTFPYVCVIVDDASTDDNKDVISGYLIKHFTIKSIEETEDYVLKLAQSINNENCCFAVFFLKYNHYSRPDINYRRREYYARFFNGAKYIAYCEGDDYWIHPDFIQTSVGFLDHNSEYSAVFGNKIVCDKDGNRLSKTKFKKGLGVKDIMRGSNMGIRNLVFRREIRNIPPFVGKARDLYIYYQCAASGKLKYIDEDFAVYRLTGIGVYSKLNEQAVIRTSYEHYYRFHAALNFKFQKQYVEYQIFKLVSYINDANNYKYCKSLIKEFHVPSTKRYFWYPVCYTIGMLVAIKNKLLK